MPKKILILYANSGFLGHKVIAENYAALLKKNGYDVEIADVLEIDSKTEIRTGKHLYFWLLKKLPWLWRWLYHYWHYVPAFNWLRISALPRRFKRSQQLVLNFKPDIVVTTHPTATSVVNFLKVKRKITAKIYAAFSDWHTQKFWVFPNVDKYLVATWKQKEDLLRLGFSEKHISVTGILISDNYYQVPSKRRAREMLCLAQNVPVILIMGGGKGWGIESIVSELLDLPFTAQIVVIGANEERREEIGRHLKSSPKNSSHFRVTGFVDPSTYFHAADLLISKPGGLTTSQAFLVSLPFLPVYPLPGQEDENLEVLLGYNAVLPLGKSLNLVAQINCFLSDRTYLHKVSAAALHLAPFKAREKILGLVSKEL